MAEYSLGGDLQWAYQTMLPLAQPPIVYICLVLLVLVVWRFWKFTVRPLLHPHEPKELPYWIPSEFTIREDAESY